MLKVIFPVPSRQRCLNVLITVCLSIFTVSLRTQGVQAQELRVVEGEYLVDGPSDKISASGGKRQGFRLVKKNGRRYDPVSRSSSKKRYRKFVKFNPEDSFCDNLIAAGEATLCSPDFEIKASVTPNDTYYKNQWGLTSAEGASATEAWNTETGRSDITVAVIDSGIDYNHPDLRANMWVNKDEIPGNYIDDDHNGYIDDIHGISASGIGLARGNPMDDAGHGTHCAGIIGASGNNSRGVTGVNWKVKLMALKFLDATGTGSTSDAIEMIDYMIEMKKRGVNLKVSNNSWGSSGYSPHLEEAIKRATDAEIIIVAAAGNISSNNDSRPAYPASISNSKLISVASLNKKGRLSSFSNYGLNSVDIAAPGSDILSTVPGGKYSSMSGTSMASPFVSGALALLMAHKPELSATQAIDRLYNLSSYNDNLAGKIRTSGALNIARMLTGDSRSEIPVCDNCHEEAPAPLISMEVKGVSRNWLVSKLSSGDNFRIWMTGSSDADYQMQIQINNYSCPETTSFSTLYGQATLGGKVPRLDRQVKKIIFSAGNIKKQILVKKPSGLDKRKDLKRRRAKRWCSRIGRSIAAE